MVAEVSGHHSCKFVINACRSLIMAFKSKVLNSSA
jgi:hypothetical protein